MNRMPLLKACMTDVLVSGTSTIALLTTSFLNGLIGILIIFSMVKREKVLEQFVSHIQDLLLMPKGFGMTLWKRRGREYSTRSLKVILVPFHQKKKHYFWIYGIVIKSVCVTTFVQERYCLIAILFLAT